jgi:predicted ester cyclase
MLTINRSIEARRTIAMSEINLREVYRRYIACLNKQDWSNLCEFVGDDVKYNGQHIGLSGYRQMLERDFREIPDLRFEIEILVCEPPHIASRLLFDCTPTGVFLGLPVHGKRIAFAENVFYEFLGDKIQQVRSVIDKAAIESQL